VNFLERGVYEPPTRVLADARFFGEESATSLGIEMVRELKSFLWQKPAVSARRSAVIYRAERLTPEAQNAILKIAEDPPRSALLILTIQNPERLLPTILSRFQKAHIFDLRPQGRPEIGGRKTRASELAELFLRASGAERRNLAKEIAEEEKEGSPGLTLLILDELITLMSEKPQKNSAILKELLTRRRLMGQYQLSKRLQLAFLATLW